MSDELLICDYRVEVSDAGTRVSATVDGDEAWFFVRGDVQVTAASEPFVAVGLLEAMVTGRNIRLSDCPALSAAVHARLSEIQAVFACWNTDLRVVEVVGDVQSDQHEYAGGGCFFSGGIDSSHTLHENFDAITHLIVSRGFDDDDAADGWARRVAKQEDFADRTGKSLIIVNHNMRQWLDARKITWRWGHGLFLSAFPAMLGLERVFVPASHTYDELFPWGSHPLTDPMWSTESTAVVHHGAGCSRSQKTRVLLQQPLLLDNLSVCWKSSVENCGSCSKCTRTLIAAHLLGGKIPSLPAYEHPAQLKAFSSVDEGLATFIFDLMVLARSVGETEIYRGLRKYYRRYHLERSIATIDKLYFGGVLRKLLWRGRRPEWITWRVPLRSPAQE